MAGRTVPTNLSPINTSFNNRSIGVANRHVVNSDLLPSNQQSQAPYNNSPYINYQNRATTNTVLPPSSLDMINDTNAIKNSSVSSILGENTYGPMPVEVTTNVSSETDAVVMTPEQHLQAYYYEYYRSDEFKLFKKSMSAIQIQRLNDYDIYAFIKNNRHPGDTTDWKSYFRENPNFDYAIYGDFERVMQNLSVQYLEEMGIELQFEKDILEYLKDNEDFKLYLKYGSETQFNFEYMIQEGYVDDYFARAKTDDEIILPDFMQEELEQYDNKIEAINAQIEAKEKQKNENLAEYRNWYSTFYDVNTGKELPTPDFLTLALFKAIHKVDWHTKKNEIAKLHAENTSLANEISVLEDDKIELESERKQTENMYKQFQYSLLINNEDFVEKSTIAVNLPFDLTYLTEEQKKILSYVYNKYGEDTAKDYYGSLEENIKIANGYQLALEELGGIAKRDANGNIIYVKDANGNYIYDQYGNKIPELDGNGINDEWLATKLGITDGLESFINGFTFADLYKDVNVMTADDYKKLVLLQLVLSIDDNNKYFYEFGNTVGNMIIPYSAMIITSAVTSIVSPTSSVKMLPSFVYSLLSFTSSYGNNIGAGLDMGLDIDSACIYSILTSGSETALELLLGGIPGAKPVSGLKEILDGMKDEAFEEAIQYLSGTIINSFYTGEFEFDAGELLKGSIYAGVLALFMSGGRIYVDGMRVELSNINYIVPQYMAEALSFKLNEMKGNEVNYDALSPEVKEIVDNMKVTDSVAPDSEVSSWIDKMSEVDFETFKQEFKNLSAEDQVNIINGMSDKAKAQELVSFLDTEQKFKIKEINYNAWFRDCQGAPSLDVALQQQYEILKSEGYSKSYEGFLEEYSNGNFDVSTPFHKQIVTDIKNEGAVSVLDSKGLLFALSKNGIGYPNTDGKTGGSWIVPKSDQIRITNEAQNSGMNPAAYERAVKGVSTSGGTGGLWEVEYTPEFWENNDVILNSGPANINGASDAAMPGGKSYDLTGNGNTAREALAPRVEFSSEDAVEIMFIVENAEVGTVIDCSEYGYPGLLITKKY